MTLEQKILGGYVVLSALILTILLWPKPKKVSGPVVLPKGDTEQIRIDPVKHTITVITAKKTTTQTLPDRQTLVDVKQDGTVKITAQQIGFETRPYLGFGLGGGARFYLGADLAYYKKADIGLGVGLPPLGKSNWKADDICPLVNVSYTIYDNTAINLGYSTNKMYHAFLSVRI